MADEGLHINFMASIYTHKDSNVRKTWLLMAVFFGIVIGIGWIFSQIYGNPSILYLAVFLSIIMNVISYWFSDRIALALHKAQPVELKSNPELYRVLENLTITAGLPMPRFYLINDPAPNAFATGRNTKNAVVCVTSGLLEKLDRSELEGVLAHELSHIGNRDMLVSTVAVVLVGFVSILADMFMRSLWFGQGRDDDRRSGSLFIIIGIALSILAPIFASLIHLAISRKREFLADASAVLLTRYPEGLVSALKKISAHGRPIRTATNATAHLFFQNPFGVDKKEGQTEERGTPWLAKLFSTHPPIEDRIKALENIKS